MTEIKDSNILFTQNLWQTLKTDIFLKTTIL